MPFLAMLALQVGLAGAEWIIGRIRADHVVGHSKPKGLSDMNLPTSEEGRPIPWIGGTCYVKSPNVLWYGDFRAQPAGGDRYNYYLGLQHGICWGEVDTIQDIRWDDRKYSEIGEYTPPPYNRTDPDVVNGMVTKDLRVNFWEDGGEGGIVGKMDLYFGTQDQESNDYLEDVVGMPIPAYRGLCCAIARGDILGASSGMNQGREPFLHPVGFVVTRCPNWLGLDDDGHQIPVAGAYPAANPAEMIYDLLTNQRIGCGLSLSKIDDAAFIAAGNTLAAEGFGLSMMLDSYRSAKDVIREICRYIDAVVDENPRTGKITIRLIRNDYDPDALPILDESIVEDWEFARPSWSETRNVIRAKWLDQSNGFSLRIAQAQDLANIAARGGIRAVEELDFSAITSAGLIQRVAERELKELSYPLGRGTLTCNRKAQGLVRGDPFKLTLSKLGISGMVCRVSRTSGGTLEDGKVRLEIVEDVFGLSQTIYSPPPASGWVQP